MTTILPFTFTQIIHDCPSWSGIANYVKHGNDCTFSTGIQPSIIKKFRSRRKRILWAGRHVWSLQPACETAAYKFMNAFLRMQKTVHAELCSTPCPNLNSCMPKQIILQNWVRKEKSCPATGWTLLLGNMCQVSRGERNTVVLISVSPITPNNEKKASLRAGKHPQPASWGLCGPPYRLWLLLLLELPDGFLSLLQLSTGLFALLFDCGQLPFDQVVLLCLLSSCNLSLGT